MITKLHLKDFQGHADSTFEFDPGVNAIIGGTDEGKSSVIRAIRLVAENRPSGNSFIRNGAKETAVTLELPEGAVVRQKGTASHKYILNGVELTAFGQGVPEAVADFIRIDPEVNIQRQSDPYFLLHASESERGKMLGRFCNMAVASLAVAIARRRGLRADKEADDLTCKLNPLKVKQDALHHFAKKGADVRALEELNGRIGNGKKKLAHATSLANSYRAFNIPPPIAIPAMPDLSGFVSLHNRLVKMRGSLATTVPAPVSYTAPDNIEGPVKLAAQLKGYKTALGNTVPPKIKYPSEPPDTHKNLQNLYLKALELRRALVGLAGQQSAVEAELEAIKAELDKIKVCPLCRQPRCRPC